MRTSDPRVVVALAALLGGTGCNWIVGVPDVSVTDAPAGLDASPDAIVRPPPGDYYLAHNETGACVITVVGATTTSLRSVSWDSGLCAGRAVFQVTTDQEGLISICSGTWSQGPNCLDGKLHLVPSTGPKGRWQILDRGPCYLQRTCGRIRLHFAPPQEGWRRDANSFLYLGSVEELDDVWVFIPT